MKEILINFLLHLNEKGLINNHDFDYEKVVKAFVNKDKNKPAIATQKHYDNGKDYDIIDFCKDYNLNFNRGNIVKYVTRAGKKDDELKDLMKAKDYLEREIKYLQDDNN